MSEYSDLVAFLSTDLTGAGRLSVFGERCAAAQALAELERLSDDPLVADPDGQPVRLRDYLRRRIETCDGILGGESA
jgi:hypothetical protein